MNDIKFSLEGLIDIDDLTFTSSDISKLIEVYLLNYSNNESRKKFISFTTSRKIYKATGIYRISYFVSKPEVIYIYGNSDILYYYNEICKLNYNVFKESFVFYVDSLGNHRHFIKSGYLSNLSASSHKMWETVGDSLKQSDSIYPPVFLNLSEYFNGLICLDTSLTKSDFNHLYKLLSLNDLTLNSDIKLDLDLSSSDLIFKLNDLSNYINGNINIILYDVNDLTDELLNLSFNSLKIHICFHPSLMNRYLDSNKVYLNGRQIGCLSNNILISEVL